MLRRTTISLLLLAGCTPVAHKAIDHAILPEQRQIAVRAPEQLPQIEVPKLPPPRTVSVPRKETAEWRLTLDDAVKVALQNARVIRVLTGVTASSAGRTIYDAAIANTVIDQAQSVFDPQFSWNNTWNRNETPVGTFDPFHPGMSLISGVRRDDYRAALGLTKSNVYGGQWQVNASQNPIRISNGTPGSNPLNPQNPTAFSLGYTQPLLQGAGFAVNTAPIVIARIDTERSFFQYKDTVQELVRGVIEGYWNLVQARTDEWARQIQVEQSKEAFERASARQKVGLTALGEVAQSEVTYNQFRAQLIAARANILTREGALRNLLGLPPEDGRQIIPVSALTNQRLEQNYFALLSIAEQQRPDVIELKLVLEADGLRLLQAENLTLPKLDASALYRWNGLAGEMPNGERISSKAGQFTDWTIGVNFSVPLCFRDGRARVRQQRLILTRDRANLEQQLHATAHTLALSLRDLDSAYDQYLAFKETRAAADRNLRVQIAEFRQGRIIYLNVLQALNDWGNSITSESQALLNYNITLANLERQTGTILQTHGLVFYEEHQRFAGPLGVFSHGVDYPSASPPMGRPRRYPDSGKPGEDAFDLQKPDIKRSGDKDKKPVKDREELPPPRELPVVPKEEAPKIRLLPSADAVGK